MDNNNTINPTGHLQIYKVFDDGGEELVFDENNIITSGMGVGWAHLFAASGGTSITDYQILNFLVGSGGNYSDYGLSTYRLQKPILKQGDWGSTATLLLEDFEPVESGSLRGSDLPFARIRFSNIGKVTSTSVRYILVLDRSTLNSRTVNEVGLFMRNPRGLTPSSPILVAYRPFTDITKTSDFSLIFRWTLQF